MGSPAWHSQNSTNATAHPRKKATLGPQGGQESWGGALAAEQNAQYLSLAVTTSS